MNYCDAAEDVVVDVAGPSVAVGDAAMAAAAAAAASACVTGSSVGISPGVAELSAVGEDEVSAAGFGEQPARATRAAAIRAYRILTIIPLPCADSLPESKRAAPWHSPSKFLPEGSSSYIDEASAEAEVSAGAMSEAGASAEAESEAVASVAAGFEQAATDRAAAAAATIRAERTILEVMMISLF